MINFNKFYKLFNIISFILMLSSILLLSVKGLNFGVDFKGGTLIELRTTDNNISVTTLRKSFNEIVHGLYLIRLKNSRFYFGMFADENNTVRCLLPLRI